MTHLPIKTSFIHLIFASACVIPLAHSATPSNIITVTDNSNSGANTLREAISLANSRAGADVINIDASLASSPILLGSEIEITEAVTINGSGVTLDATNSKIRHLKIVNADTKIDNLKFINGYHRRKPGGAIYAESSNLTITNSHFADNMSEKAGGAISVNSSDGNQYELIIENSVFTNNKSRKNGGAIAGEKDVPITIKNSRFTKNESIASRGGAVEFFKLTDGKHKILNSTFDSNKSSVSGGVISLIESELFIENSTFYKNTAVNSGAVFNSKSAKVGLLGDQSTLTVTRSTFYDNTIDPLKRNAELFAPGQGGTKITLQNSIFIKTLDADISKNKKLCLKQIRSEYNAQYNVMSDNTCAKDQDIGNTILDHTKPLSTVLVGTLSDNGCKIKAGIKGEKECVKTLTLVDDSPAIDLGKAKLRLQEFDQRGTGYPRKIGPIEDAGAIEFGTINREYSISTLVKPNNNYGTINCPDKVKEGYSAKCIATANSGYEFVSFESGCDSISNNECFLKNVLSDKTIIAAFKAEVMTYDISAVVNASTGGTVSCTATTVSSGNSADCTATAQSGYQLNRFEGCDAISANTCHVSNVTSDRKVVVFFALTPALVSVTGITSPSYAGTVTCLPSSVSIGEDSSCTAKPENGYRFTGFASDDCNIIDQMTCHLYNIQSNRQINARFVAYTQTAPRSVPTLSTYMLLMMAIFLALFSVHWWSRRN